MFASYDDMITYLFSLRQMSVKLGLDNINRLLAVLDHPERSLAAIHVAGTNGKGSTCAMFDAVLRAAGYKCGLYTSPHLIDVRERIRINGSMISTEVFKNYFEFLLPTIEAYGSSFFEVLTAIAFAFFRDEKLDIAIIETGLGGRLDATNVITPVVSVITEIDIDHVKQLGNTPLAIAREKAGIIKPGVPVVTNASQREVLQLFASICAEQQAQYVDTCDGALAHNVRSTQNGTIFDLTTPTKKWQELRLPLLGLHQVRNAMTVVRTIELLRQMKFVIPDQAVFTGLSQVDWPGRMQVLQTKPILIIDAAHNPNSIQMTLTEIKRIFPYRRMICVFGVLADKDFPRMIEIMNSFVDRFVAVTPQNERGLAAAALADKIAQTGKAVTTGASIPAGVEQARALAGAEDLICVIGSHFIIGEVLKLYKNS